MTAKEKIIGFLIILLGAYPFLLKIQNINSVLGKYTWLAAGAMGYQIILILLGLFLIIEKKKIEVEKR